MVNKKIDPTATYGVFNSKNKDLAPNLPSFNSLLGKQSVDTQNDMQGNANYGYQIPSFEERTPYGTKWTNPYTKLFEDRIVFLGVVLDDAIAEAVMAQLLVLESQDPNRDITLYINSYGGASTAMTAIYDTIQYISSKVNTVCLGIAASAAAVILASGAKGSRLALPNSQVMIHQPSFEGSYGQASDIEIQAREINRIRVWLENTLCKHTGKPIEQIHSDIERDKWLTAPEAKEYGLVDKVLNPRKK